jgi:hypothetical protein
MAEIQAFYGLNAAMIRWAISIPTRSCASAVDAPICGLTEI